jgi:hypothetical protein
MAKYDTCEYILETRSGGTLITDYQKNTDL